MCCYLKLVVFLLTFVTIHFYCISTSSLPISNQCNLIVCISGDINLCNVQNKQYRSFCKSFSKTHGLPVDKIDRCCEKRNRCYDRIRKCHFLANNPLRFEYEWQCKAGNVSCISNISRSSSEMTFCHQLVCWCDRQYAMCLSRNTYSDQIGLFNKMNESRHPIYPKLKKRPSDDSIEWMLIIYVVVKSFLALLDFLLMCWICIWLLGPFIVDKYRRMKYIIRHQKDKFILWCKGTKKVKKRMVKDVKYTPEQKWIIAQEINRRQYVLNRVNEPYDVRENGWMQIGERIKAKGVPIKSHRHIRHVTWYNMRKKALRHHRYQPNMMNELDRLIVKMTQDSEKHLRENVVVYLG